MNAMNVPTRKYSIGTIATVVIGVGGGILAITAFLQNSSPYGDFADAKRDSSKEIHVAGTVDKKTLTSDAKSHQLEFDMVDQNGVRMHVVYRGRLENSLAEADRVVAIGSAKNGVFESNRLLVKCPSKYNDKKTDGAAPS